MKLIKPIITVLVASLVAVVCFAAEPTLTDPTTTNVGAGSATLVMKSSEDGKGYFTVRSGSTVTCGTGGNVAFGPYSSGSYHGSLPLTANLSATYTVRNLTENKPYTVCFTADDSTAPNLNPTPVFANISTTSSKTLTYPGWSALGGAGFSVGQAHFTTLAFAPTGTPYVAYVDANDSYKISVMRYDGSNWNSAGSAGFGWNTPVSLAFAPDGTLYLSFVDSAYTTQVKKLSGVDTWTPVGTGLSADTDVTSMAFAPDGTPYVSYIDGSDSRATVMKYSAGNWSSTAISTSAASSTSLAVAPDGTIYVAYSDYGYSGKATVMMFNGTTWSTVGILGFSAGAATKGSLAIAPDGTPYLAYQDEAYSGRATVMKFTGGTWNLVDDAGFSTGTATTISLAIAPDGKPTVAFQDGANSAKATVKKYNDTDWITIGSVGFSAASASSTTLAFAPDGLPYVVYGDNGNGSRATLMQFTDINPIISGIPPATATVGVEYSFPPIVTPAAWYATEFLIDNKPSWASFDTGTGKLSGTPLQNHIGTYSGIVITAKNSAGTSALPVFSIEVTAATSTGSVRVLSTLTTYPNITAALGVTGNQTLQILTSITPEGVDYSGSGMKTLEGGYDVNWSRSAALFSRVSSLTVTDGTLIIDRIEVSSF